MYCVMWASAPSLHIASTDGMIEEGAIQFFAKPIFI